MTDREIADGRMQALEIERTARATWNATPVGDQAERDAALVAVRKSAELAAVLERWITARALRAALTS